MRRMHLAVACAVGLAGWIGTITGVMNGDQKPEAKPVTVTMKSLGYDPRQLEIHVGDSVVWANESRTTHTAMSDDEGKTFDTGEVEPGQSSKPIKFEQEGEFKYHCKVHGKSMSGAIVVKPVQKN